MDPALLTKVSMYLSDDQRNQLLKELTYLNGEHLYEAINSSAGWLPEKEYFVCPRYIAEKYGVENVEDVGDEKEIPLEELILIVAMNYERLNHLDADNRMKVAFIRAELMTRGVINKQGKAFFVRHDEIEFSDHSPADDVFEAVTKYFGDASKGDERRKLAELSVIAPAMASIEFLKTNHHYVESADYRQAYDRHFKSAVKMELSNLLPYALLFHTAIHWIGPAGMFYYAKKMEIKSALPDGIVLKLRTGPAGSALITTSSAILKNMEILPFYNDMREAHGIRIDKVRTMAERILADPLPFHLHAELFGKPKWRDSEEFKEAYEAAAQLSPFTQAFLEVFARGSPLAEAKAINKHAAENVGVKTLFAIALRKFLTEARRSGTVRQALALEAKPADTVHVEADDEYE
jgi:hypothetical protein